MGVWHEISHSCRFFLLVCVHAHRIARRIPFMPVVEHILWGGFEIEWSTRVCRARAYMCHHYNQIHEFVLSLCDCACQMVITEIMYKWHAISSNGICVSIFIRGVPGRIHPNSISINTTRARMEANHKHNINKKKEEAKNTYRHHTSPSTVTSALSPSGRVAASMIHRCRRIRRRRPPSSMSQSWGRIRRAARAGKEQKMRKCAHGVRTDAKRACVSQTFIVLEIRLVPSKR